MNKSGKYLLFGLAAGAVAGLLLAPDKGENTRKYLKDKINESANDIGPEIENVSKQVNNMMEKINGFIQELKKMRTSEMAEKTPVENF
jgi:gas vesicle protein